MKLIAELSIVANANAELDTNTIKPGLLPMDYSKDVVIHDPDYYLEMVELETKDTMFALAAVHLGIGHKPLERHVYRIIEPVGMQDGTTSDHFSLLFAMIDNELSPGKSRKHSLVQDWLAILKLSHVWPFSNFRPLIVDRVPKLFKHSNTDLLSYGREYKVFEWLVSAYSDMIGRMEDVSISEANALGTMAFIRVMANREAIRDIMWPKGHIVLSSGERTNKSMAAMQKFRIGTAASLPPMENPVAGLLLAKQEGVLEWLWDAFTTLVRRSESLDREEAVKLGLDISISICRARETRLRTSSQEVQSGSEWGLHGWEWSSQGWDLPCLTPTLGPAETVDRDDFDRHVNTTSGSFTAIERYKLAVKLGVPRWIESTLLELIEREEPIAVAEARILGPALAVAICRARDLFQQSLRNMWRESPSPAKASEQIASKARKLASIDLLGLFWQ